MTLVYEMIGRAVVRFVRARFRKQIRVAAVALALAVALAGYLAASRSVDEG